MCKKSLLRGHSAMTIYGMGDALRLCEALQSLEIFHGASFSPQIVGELGFVVSVNIQTCFSTFPGDRVSNTLSQHWGGLCMTTWPPPSPVSHTGFSTACWGLFSSLTPAFMEGASFRPTFFSAGHLPLADKWNVAVVIVSDDCVPRSLVTPSTSAMCFSGHCPSAFPVWKNNNSFLVENFKHVQR